MVSWGARPVIRRGADEARMGELALRSEGALAGRVVVPAAARGVAPGRERGKPLLLPGRWGRKDGFPLLPLSGSDCSLALRASLAGLSRFPAERHGPDLLGTYLAGLPQVALGPTAAFALPGLVGDDSELIGRGRWLLNPATLSAIFLLRSGDVFLTVDLSVLGPDALLGQGIGSEGSLTDTGLQEAG